MPTVGFDLEVRTHMRARCSGPTKPFCSILTKLVAHSDQSAPDHVQNETRRPRGRQTRLFPSQRQRFAPIPVWPMPI